GVHRRVESAAWPSGGRERRGLVRERRRHPAARARRDGAHAERIGSLLSPAGEDRARRRHSASCRRRRRVRDGRRRHVRRRRDALSCAGQPGRHVVGEGGEQERGGTAGARRGRAARVERRRCSTTAPRQGGRVMVRRREVLKAIGATTAAVALGPFVHARPARADKGELVVVTWGGSLVKAQRKAYFEGFEKETGIKIKDDTPPTPAKLKTMVESGNVTWDVIETDLAAILTMRNDNLLEPIDFAKLDKRALDSIYPATRLPDAVGSKIYSFNLVYNTKALPAGKHPRTWADMWDGKKFAGGRSMNFGGGVTPQLEIALLADGVPKDKLYPVDVA